MDIIDISNNRECRICFESTNEDDLISPCFCRGTSKWVHHSCLQRWRENSENVEAKIKCMECNYEYDLLNINQPENIEIINFFVNENNEIRYIYIRVYISFLIFCLLTFQILLIPIEKYDNYVSIHILNYVDPKNNKFFLNYIKNNDFYYFMYFYSLNLNININIAYFLLLVNLYLKIKFKKIFFNETFINFYKNIAFTNSVYIFYYIFIYTETIGMYILLHFFVQITNYFTVKNLFLNINKTIKKINTEQCNQRILNYISDDSSSSDISLYENKDNENIILLDKNII
jgi:hypothetical protein